MRKRGKSEAYFILEELAFEHEDLWILHEKFLSRDEAIKRARRCRRIERKHFDDEVKWRVSEIKKTVIDI